MKITAIKTFPLKVARDIFLVKVETDEGIYGLGEGGCSSRELAEAAAVDHFSQFLIGMDPMRIEHIWQKCYRSNYHEGGRVLTGAISAIDIALWDIMGKKLGVPVYQLLGGACRERVFGFPTLGIGQQDCLERCRDFIAQGWPCIRLIASTPIPSWAAELHQADTDPANMFEPRASIADTAERLAALRPQLDRSIPLGVEYHHRLSVAEAAAFCQQAPPGSIAFLEEPIRDETPAAYETLRQMTGVPFAIGEEWSSKWQALPYIEKGLTNFCRLDVCNIGGLSEAMKVAGWSEAHYIDIMPHNPLGADRGHHPPLFRGQQLRLGRGEPRYQRKCGRCFSGATRTRRSFVPPAHETRPGRRVRRNRSGRSPALADGYAAFSQTGRQPHQLVR